MVRVTQENQNQSQSNGVRCVTSNKALHLDVGRVFWTLLKAFDEPTTVAMRKIRNGASVAGIQSRWTPRGYTTLTTRRTLPRGMGPPQAPIANIKSKRGMVIGLITIFIHSFIHTYIHTYIYHPRTTLKPHSSYFDVTSPAWLCVLSRVRVSAWKRGTMGKMSDGADETHALRARG